MTIAAKSCADVGLIGYPVVVRNAYKSYSSKRNGEDSVLVNLSISVAKGTIYAILGPSGCGKTTLLRCIIGRLALDSGYICTLGQIPGSHCSGVPGPMVGYMPQEDALDGIMSIKELLNYYGCILGLNAKQIHEKTKFLIDFLKLPSENTIFSTLSGGQKKRVSFAVALVHDAQLLLLDEPTVGVDPILKQSIWSYLFELAQNGRTVVITTHYIDEARGSDTVMMMFNGRVLAEGPPDKLIAHYEAETLENVFLHICLHNQMNHGAVLPDVSYCSGPDITMINQSYNTATKSSMLNVFNCSLNSYSGIDIKRLQAIIYRGLIQFIRFPGLLFLLMASPAFQIALCGFSLGRSLHSVPVGVVNTDEGPLGDKFLSLINADVILQRNYTTWELARQSAIDGETFGVIMFGHNFSTCVVERFNNTLHIDRKALLESTINVSLDGSSFLFVETIRFALLHAFETFVNDVLTEFNLEQSLAKMPLLRDEPIFGNFEDPFSVFIMPSFITGSSFFAEMGLSIIVFYLDKADGKLERIYSAGVTPIEIIFGFLALQMVFLLAEVILMLVMAFVVFQFNNSGSIALVVALSVLQGLCGAIVGILISATSRTFPNCSISSMTVLVSSVALGGYFWPLEATTPTLRLFCMMLPFGISANAMRHIMYRRWNLTHLTIQLAFSVNIIWIVTVMFICVTIFRMKKQ